MITLAGALFGRCSGKSAETPDEGEIPPEEGTAAAHGAVLNTFFKLDNSDYQEQTG